MRISINIVRLTNDNESVHESVELDRRSSSSPAWTNEL